MNDGYPDAGADNPAARAYERLLRKLLALPGAPAVVLVHFFQTDIKKNNLPFHHTCGCRVQTTARDERTSSSCAGSSCAGGQTGGRQARQAGMQPGPLCLVAYLVSSRGALCVEALSSQPKPLLMLAREPQRKTSMTRLQRCAVVLYRWVCTDGAMA